VSDWTGIIKEVGRGARGARDLSEADAERLFGAMLDGEVPELELGALWIAYRIKGESTSELLGFCRAVSARMPKLPLPEGPRPVILPTYNGARRLPNMTPLLALLLAREGVPVLIHGVAEAYGRVTTAAILSELNIDAAADAMDAAARLEKDRLVYLPLDVLSPGLGRLMAMRRRIGVRSSAHTVSKLLDPWSGSAVRVVPVTHPDYVRRMGEFFAAERGMAVLMRGTEGEPYAHPQRMPALMGFTDGEGRELEPRGEHQAVEAKLPPDFDAGSTAHWTRAVLEGVAQLPATLLCQVDRLVAQSRAGLRS
jgi:anthranilate phosphoribosyltransferase